MAEIYEFPFFEVFENQGERIEGAYEKLNEAIGEGEGIFEAIIELGQAILSESQEVIIASLTILIESFDIDEAFETFDRSFERILNAIESGIDAVLELPPEELQNTFNLLLASALEVLEQILNDILIGDTMGINIDEVDDDL